MVMAQQELTIYVPSWKGVEYSSYFIHKSKTLKQFLPSWREIVPLPD